MERIMVGAINEVADLVKGAKGVRVSGRSSKCGLGVVPAGALWLDLSALRGVVAYEPAEFTFTALAGTPISEIEALLSGRGQYLPFDPILAESGATLGGTVAANGAGPGRYRYGGVRDFILEVRFVDGQGNLVRGGGKVVKNAAGFDLPKLMVGSLGRLGILLELTFKVFPKPQQYLTVQADFANLGEGLAAMQRLVASPLELDGLDLTPAGRLWVRLGGLAGSLPGRAQTLIRFLGRGQLLEDEADLWRAGREFSWRPAATSLVKVALTPQLLLAFDGDLPEIMRRYSVAGNVAWLAWAGPLPDLHALLVRHGLSGQVLVGPAGTTALLGRPPDPIFWSRVKQALDPAGKLGDLVEPVIGP